MEVCVRTLQPTNPSCPLFKKKRTPQTINQLTASRTPRWVSLTRWRQWMRPLNLYRRQKGPCRRWGAGMSMMSSQVCGCVGLKGALGPLEDRARANSLQDPPPNPHSKNTPHRKGPNPSQRRERRPQRPPPRSSVAGRRTRRRQSYCMWSCWANPTTFRCVVSWLFLEGGGVCFLGVCGCVHVYVYNPNYIIND